MFLFSCQVFILAFHRSRRRLAAWADRLTGIAGVEPGRGVDVGVGTCDGRSYNGIVGGMWEDGAKVAMGAATERCFDTRCVGFQCIT